MALNKYFDWISIIPNASIERGGGNNPIVYLANLRLVSKSHRQLKRWTLLSLCVPCPHTPLPGCCQWHVPPSAMQTSPWFLFRETHTIHSNLHYPPLPLSFIHTSCSSSPSALIQCCTRKLTVLIILLHLLSRLVSLALVTVIVCNDEDRVWGSVPTASLRQFTLSPSSQTTRPGHALRSLPTYPPLGNK